LPFKVNRWCKKELKVELLNQAKNPFLSLTQGQTLKEIVVMPLWAFNKLAEKVGHPKHEEVKAN